MGCKVSLGGHEINLRLHKLPLVGYRIGHLLLARRLYRNERTHRAKEPLKESILKLYEEGELRDAEDRVAAANPELSGETLKDAVIEQEVEERWKNLNGTEKHALLQETYEL